MFSFKLLTAALAVCQAFNIPLPNSQAVLDIDIHINSNSRDAMSMNSDEMSMGSSDMQMYSGDTPMHTDALIAQYSRGLVASTNIEPYDSFIIVGVGKNGPAYATMFNNTWIPSYKNYINLGGSFNKSLGIYSFGGTVYVAGTTQTNNLVLKNIANSGVLYPKTTSWILLAEGEVDGTPSVASHDNKTISIVARQKDGTLIHRLYDPETDGISSDVTIPNKKFASNPALLVRPGNKLQVYATDSGGQMHFSEWKSGKTWTGWTPLGGDFVGDPATKWLGSQGDVWSVGKDGSVSARYFSDSDCFSATWVTLPGQGCLNTGALHYWGPKFQYADFFCQTSSPIRMIRRDGDKMTGSEVGGTTYAAPAVFEWHYKGTAYSDVIVVGMDSAMYRKQRTVDTWAAWEQLAGVFQS